MGKVRLYSQVTLEKVKNEGSGARFGAYIAAVRKLEIENRAKAESKNKADRIGGTGYDQL